MDNILPDQNDQNQNQEPVIDPSDFESRASALLEEQQPVMAPSKIDKENFDPIKFLNKRAETYKGEGTFKPSGLRDPELNKTADTDGVPLDAAISEDTYDPFTLKRSATTEPQDSFYTYYKDGQPIQVAPESNALTEWRVQTLINIDNGIGPDTTQDQKFGAVLAHLNAAADIDIQNASQLTKIGPAAYKHIFNKELPKGADFIESYYEELKGVKSNREMEHDFNRLLATQAFAALFTDESRFTNLNNKRILEHPHYKKIENKSEMRRLFDGMRADASLTHGDVIPQVREILKLVEKQVTDVGEIRLSDLTKILGTVSADDLTKVAQAVAFVDYNMSEFYDVGERGAILNLAEQTLRDYERFSDNQVSGFLKFFLQIAEQKVKEGEEITGIDTSETQEELKQKAEAIDRIARFAGELRTYEQKYDPIKQIFNEDSVLGHLEKATYQIPGIGMSLALATTPMTLGSMLYEGILDNYHQKAIRAGIDREEARLLVKPAARVIAAGQSVLEIIGANAVLRGAPFLRKWAARFDKEMTRVLLSTAGSAAVETITEESQLIIERMGEDFINGIKKEFPPADWDAHWETFGWRQFEMFLSVAPYSGLGSLARSGQITEAIELQKTASEDQLVALGFSRSKVERFKNATEEKDQRVLFLEMVAEQNPRSDEAKEAIRILEEKENARREAWEQLSKSQDAPGIRTSKDNKTFQIYEPVTGDTLFEYATERETQQAFFELLGTKDEGPAADQLVSLLGVARERTGESGLVTELDLSKAVTEATLRSILPNGVKAAQERIALAEETETGTRTIAETVFGTEASSKTFAGVYLPAGMDGQSSPTIKLFAGSSAWTLIHEKAHHTRRLLIDNKAISKEKQISFFKKLNSVIGDKTYTRTVIDTDGNKAKQLIPLKFEGFDGDTVSDMALDEAFATFAEVAVLNTRKGEKTTLRELLQKNLDALVRVNANGAVEFRAFIRALKEWFGLNLRRAAVFKKATREGKLDRAEMEEFTAMVLGETIDEQHVKRVDQRSRKEAPSFQLGRLPQLNKNSANNLADTLGVPRFIPAEYEGKRILPIMADLLATGLYGDKDLQGGPAHPLLFYKGGSGVVWRSKWNAIVGMLTYFDERGGVWTDENGIERALVSVFAMNQDSHQSNMDTFVAYIKQLDKTKLSKEDKKTLAEYVRKKAQLSSYGAPKNEEEAQITVDENGKINDPRALQKFPETWTIKSLSEYGSSLSFDLRAAFIKMMGLDEVAKTGLKVPRPDVIIKQLIDESYSQVSPTSMLSILEVDVTRLREGVANKTLKGSDFGVAEHISYNTVLPGKIVAHFREPVAMNIAFGDMVQKIAEVSPDSRPSYLLMGKLPAEVELELLTKEKIEKINNLQKSPIAAAKAKAHIAHFSNKWTPLKKGSLKKGKADYTNARLNYLYTDLLDPNLAKDFTKLANKKGYEAYGLEGFDLWFTLAPTEAGGKEIIELVSNEANTIENGLVDIVINKALANGATNVTTYAVPSAAASDGILPAIYKDHGFVEVSRKPYSKKELGSTAKERNAKEKELFALWQSQGWDQALHGMPDLVALEYADTGRRIKNPNEKSVAQEQIAEAGAKSTKPISRYDSYSGSGVDGRSFEGNFGEGRARDTREIYSFVSELEAATGDRLQAWGLTEAQRDTLLEEILDPDAGIAFSIGSQNIANGLFDTALDRVTNPEAKAKVMFNIAARVEKLKVDIDDLKQSEIADINRASRLESLKAELEELENYEPEVNEFEQERLDKIEKEIEEQDELLNEEIENLTEAHKNRAFKIEVKIASRYEKRIEAATGQKKSGLKREAKSVRSEKLKAENKRFTDEKKLAKQKASKKLADLRNKKAKAEADARRAALKENHILRENKIKLKRKIENIESYNKVAQIRDSIEALDALILSLPVELRGKIGGYAPLSKLNTEEKRLEYLFKKMDKVESVVEKYIRGKYLVEIKKLFKKAKQKTKEPRPKSTLDADILDKVKEVEALAKLTEKEKLDKLSAIEDQLDKTKDPAQEEILEQQKLRISEYANIRSMGSLQLDSFYNNLRTLIETGKTLRDFYLETQKLIDAENIKMVNHEITGGKGRMTANEAESKQKLRDRVLIKLRAIGAPDDVTLGSLNAFHRKNISFEWILNALTRNSGTETLQSETNKNLARMVHVATNEEKRANNENTIRYKAFLSHIFGGITGVKLSKRIEKEFLEKIENSGVIKTDYRGKRAYDVKEISIEDFLAVLNNEKTFRDLGLTQVEFESARDYYNQKVDRNVEAAIIDEQIAQEKENEAAAKENRKPKKIKRNPRKVSLKKVKYNSFNVGEVINLTLTQGEAINLTMLYRQEGIKESMELEGYTEETMQQMEDFLTEESKKVRAWLTKEYDENYNIINDVYKRQNGANLPKIKFYSPAVRLYQGDVKDLEVDSQGTRALSTTPAFAITRTTNFAEVDRTANALDLYVRHMAQTHHYVAWAEPVRKLRAIFADKDVKQNTIEYAGRDLLTLINERIDWFADGGNRKAKHYKILDTLRTAHTYSSLAYNYTIGLKQLTSLPAYAFDMPWADYAKYQTKFFANPIKNVQTMINLPYVKTRFKEGFDRDVIEGLKKGGASYIVKGLQHGMLLGKLGDITPVIIGGWMARQRSYDMSIAEGLSEKEAWAKADIDFEMITDRAQQAGDLKDISSFQGGDSLARMFTMYATSPRQYYANVYETLADYRAGRKNAGKAFARKFFIGHVILPFLFQYASDMLRHIGDDEELEFNDYLRAFLLGPLNGVFIIGDWLEMFFSAVAGTKVYSNKNPMSEAAEYTFRNWDKDWEFTRLADEMLKGIGKGVPSVPTYYSIIRRELKRFDDPR